MSEERNKGIWQTFFKKNKQNWRVIFRTKI